MKNALEVIDFGWFVTLPLPLREQAEIKLIELLTEYDEAIIQPVTNGYVVKYRNPKQFKEELPMQAQAIEKLTAEINASNNNSYIKAVGQFLLSHVQQNPQDAEKILAEDKTIAKSLVQMRKAAEGQKMDGVGVLSDADGFVVVLKYFGIEGAVSVPADAPAPVTAPASNFDVKLDDLL